MERFIPVESFRKKGNTFPGISFFSVWPEFPEISVPFVHSYSARLFTVILPRKIWKMAADFQNVYLYNVYLCSSVVLVDVLKQNCNPAGENELCFVVGTCVFLCFHDSGFQRRCFRLSYTWEKMWMLIAGFPEEMWMLQQPKEANFAFFSKQRAISKSSDKTSSTAGSSAVMFLVGIRNSDQMIRFNLFRFLSGKKCSSIRPEKNYRKFQSNGKRSKSLKRLRGWHLAKNNTIKEKQL